STTSLRRELMTNGFILKEDNGVRLNRPALESLRDTDLKDIGFNLGVPVLVCHGTADTRIPVQTSLDAAARSRADLVRFCLFDGASHSFRPENEHRPKLIETIVQWLRTTNRQLTTFEATRSTGQPSRNSDSPRGVF